MNLLFPYDHLLDRDERGVCQNVAQVIKDRFDLGGHLLGVRGKRQGIDGGSTLPRIVRAFPAAHLLQPLDRFPHETG